MVFSGAGKTHTMLGIDSDPGIMVRTLNDLFKKMELTSADSNYEVTMSYLEVNLKIHSFFFLSFSTLNRTVDFRPVKAGIFEQQISCEFHQFGLRLSLAAG